MRQFPTLFVSHGAPTLAIEPGPAHHFLRTLGEELGRPASIVVLSAHFDAPVATITAGAAPDTIYDFGGFPEALYKITYAAPGNPVLANQISNLLSAAGIPTRLDDDRGLDHGAWVPLSLMYPDAEVPVVQVSIDSRQDPAYHFRLGELLRPLREEGVLIVGSGGATHNLALALRASQDAPLVDWANTFREWLAGAIENDRRSDLADYRTVAPDALRNHPTQEHFLPLLCAMGAAERDEPGSRIHKSDTYGALAMDMYLFGAP